MIVNSLLQGKEDAERLDLILSLTSIASGSIKAALRDHYVNGQPTEMCCLLHDVARQNFNRSRKRLNEVYRVTCAIHGVG